MAEKISVLMVGYESAPFYKRGGLGDVMASLPKALSQDRDIDIRIVIPHYQAIVGSNIGEKRIGQFFINFGKKEEEVGVYKTYFPGTKIAAYFLSNKPNLSYINTRGRNKKIDQFAFFDLAVSAFVPWLSKNESWKISLVHCNDWQTALVPLILQKKMSLNLPTLLTIHNLNYQGKGSLKVLDLLHIRDEDTKELKIGKPIAEINVLGEGIMHATAVSTVSPTYAKEIFENYDHDKISDFLERRKNAIRENHSTGLKKREDVVGILNGIDYEIWNPEIDEYIYHKFDTKNMEEGKKNNKEDLLKALSLSDLPTFCFIGRIVWQKGIDILIRAVKKMKVSDFNLIFLGSGTPAIERSVLEIAKRFPKNIKAIIDYNEEMAHKFYAGSDFIVIPSRYEPCGLVQMVAMGYGTIPIAAKTGGLADSIKDAENGILFKKNSASSLLKSMKEALRIYEDQKQLKFMIMRALKTDFSWDNRVPLYKKLYEEMIQPK